MCRSLPLNRPSAVLDHMCWFRYVAAAAKEELAGSVPGQPHIPHRPVISGCSTPHRTSRQFVLASLVPSDHPVTISRSANRRLGWLHGRAIQCTRQQGSRSRAHSGAGHTDTDTQTRRLADSLAKGSTNSLNMYLGTLAAHGNCCLLDSDLFTV